MAIYLRCIKQQPWATQLVDRVFTTTSDESGCSREIQKSRTTFLPAFEVGATYPVYAILVRNDAAIKYVLSGEPFDDSHSGRWLSLVESSDFELTNDLIPAGWSWQIYADRTDYRAAVAPREWGNLFVFLTALQSNDVSVRNSFLFTRSQMLTRDTRETSNGANSVT